MSHDIFGERFISNREPAWHGLGKSNVGDINAVDALRLAGGYRVEKLPLFTQIVLTNGKPARLRLDDQAAIIRYPTDDDPRYVTFGVVADTYELLDPWQFAQMWDDRVRRNIETLGVISDGKTIFITTKMPSLFVKGDDREQVDNYLIAHSPMTGSDAAQARVSPVRVVCQNTLALSRSMATQSCRVIHNGTAIKRLGDWLEGVWVTAETQLAEMAAAFEVMASSGPDGGKEVDMILRAIYPEPKASELLVQDDVLARRVLRNTRRTNQMGDRREAVLSLFEGDGTGKDTAATKDKTWYWLYNCITETENYRNARSPLSAAQDIMFGKRHNTMANAFQQCFDAALGANVVLATA
jgi:hypothetical protein